MAQSKERMTKSFVCPKSHPYYCSKKNSTMRKKNSENQCATLETNCNIDTSERKFLPSFEKCNVDDSTKSIVDLEYKLTRVCQESDITEYNKAHGTDYDARTMLGYYQKEFNKDGIKQKIKQGTINESKKAMIDTVNIELDRRKSDKVRLNKWSDESIQKEFSNYEQDDIMAHKEINQEHANIFYFVNMVQRFKQVLPYDRVKYELNEYTRTKNTDRILNLFGYDSLTSLESDLRDEIWELYSNRYLRFDYSPSAPVDPSEIATPKDYVNILKTIYDEQKKHLFTQLNKMFETDKISIETTIESYINTEETQCHILKDYITDKITKLQAGDEDYIFKEKSKLGQDNFDFLTQFVSKTKTLTCKSKKY
jgi:hypothetical protein